MCKIKITSSSKIKKAGGWGKQWQVLIVPLFFFFFQESNVLIAANSQGTIKVSYFTHLAFKHLNVLIVKSKVRDTEQARRNH